MKMEEVNCRREWSEARGVVAIEMIVVFKKDYYIQGSDPVCSISCTWQG